MWFLNGDRELWSKIITDKGSATVAVCRSLPTSRCVVDGGLGEAEDREHLIM